MRRLAVPEVRTITIRELGLDPGKKDLLSAEALAAALRRASGFLCPCTSNALVHSVVVPLRGLVDDVAAAKLIAEEVLEAMVAHGDILEHNDITHEPINALAGMLYAAPPSFVVRSSGTIILLGTASDHLSALPERLEARIAHVGHLRCLAPVPGEDLTVELTELGLIQLSASSWLRAPQRMPPDQHLQRLGRVLDAAPASNDIPGLLVLDPLRPVRYYRGRWVEPRLQSGRFVARRKQAYGADLWCYVELRGGFPQRLVDLPLKGSRWRGCDEAWHLQMAIDAQRGERQQFRIRPGPEGTQVMEFFSPVPMWARRRWDAVGDPVPASGCLFAYGLADTELDEEVHFLREVLWLTEAT